MKIANLSILPVLLLISYVGLAQQLNEDYESLLLEEEKSTTGIAFKPIIAAGVGTFSFYGDVTDYFGSPLNGLTSTRIAITRNISNSFDIEFHGTFGSVSGNSYDGNAENSMNFKTSLFLGGVSTYYNFNHLLKRKRPIHPYISLGVEIIQFTPKGDLYDANNTQYHYWDDGTIRDFEQSTGQAGNLINRDYSYETDLRGEDLYGYGLYSLTSVAIPVEAGVNFAISDRVTARIGAALHIPFTDYIDNYKSGGSANYDLILNTYISLSIDLFSAADEIAAVETFKNLKFTITDNQDEDGDGVNDFNDECPETPAGVKVTFRGCPEDDDKDGVPNYLDKQNTPSTGDVIVGANGIRLIEAQLIVLLYDPDAVKRSEVKLYRQKSNGAGSIDISKGIPEKLKSVDTNGDNYISLDELNNAIDQIFEMNSTLTPDDIYELQEFFFNQ